VKLSSKSTVLEFMLLGRLIEDRALFYYLVRYGGLTQS
jgi:hypothetical protein